MPLQLWPSFLPDLPQLAGPYVPDQLPDGDTLGAAFAYAKSTGYLVPIKRGSKSPGTGGLGPGWPAKSHRDPEVIAGWLAGTDLGIALHCGRSGLVALDVDHPEQVDDRMRADVLDNPAVPFQSTRDNDPQQGHYLFQMPPNRHIGNPSEPWGEVRGENGVIMLAPSVHQKAAIGGHYQWKRTGPIPIMPAWLSTRWADHKSNGDVATDVQVALWLNAHPGGRPGQRPGRFKSVLDRYQSKKNLTRHGALVGCLAWACKEIDAGQYGADVLDQLRTMHLEALTDPAHRNGAAPDRRDWEGALAWAIAQSKNDPAVDGLNPAPKSRIPATTEELMTGVRPDDGSASPGTVLPQVPTTPFDAPDPGWPPKERLEAAERARAKANQRQETPAVTEATVIPIRRPEPLTKLWDRRPEFGVIHQWARSAMVSPGAVLLVVLGRVLATVPPWVVLPPLIGGRPGGSLNTFVAIAGPSQAGKDAAADCAAAAVQLPLTHWRFTDDDDPFPYSVPLGSGEGLAHQYAHRTRKKINEDPKDRTTVSVVERIRESSIFEVSEVGTLTKSSGRNGSTIMENLCILWTGKALGQANADPERRLPIAAHSYRAVALFGVQPRKAGPLFDAEDGGLPQRMVWADAIDPTMPTPGNIPEAPAPWSMAPQDWHLGRPANGEFLVLSVPNAVRDAVRETRYRIGSGRETDSYAGHLMFSREKIAQALALLNGRRLMIEEDWEISGLIIDQSELVRAEVQTEVFAAGVTGNKNQGIARGHAEVAARSVIRDAEAALLAEQVERIRGRILALFAEGASLPKGRIRSDRFGRKDERDAFDAAWADLVEKGLLVPDGGKWRRS